jgi:hypothetical protein
VLIDCANCSQRGISCHDCVVTALLGPPPPALAMDQRELDALSLLAREGLLPPLRLVRSVQFGSADSPDGDIATA